MLVCSILCGTHVQAADTLEKGFQSPPDSAKPWIYWIWMNGNITRDGITTDLEAMHRVGIGGVLLFADLSFPIPAETPQGPVRLMSHEWYALMNHLVKEADRLGIKVSLHNATGWCGSGGPWNTPENAMQQLSISETKASGPAHFSAVLPQPDTRLAHYRDITVLAFPTPKGDEVTMQSLLPKVTSSANSLSYDCLFDGKSDTAAALPLAKDTTGFIQFEFNQPLAVRSATVLLGTYIGAPRGIIQRSSDGRQFTDIQKISFPIKNKNIPYNSPVIFSFGDNSTPVRFYRIVFSFKNDLSVAEVSLSPGMRNIEPVEKSGMRKIGQLEKLVLEAGTLSPDMVISKNKIINLSSKMNANGTLNWDVPQGSWTILRIGHTPIALTNHPASEQGSGLECDKMSSKALDAHWAGFIQKILTDVSPFVGTGKTLTGAHIDSWEGGGQNWTPGFNDEFKRLRGYDPLPYLVTITGRIVDNLEVTDRFLWDMRRTVADLIAEKYFRHFQELCSAHGLDSSAEPYTGVPYESLQSGAAADIPMAEFWIDHPLTDPSKKLVSSIGHSWGRKIIAAEAYTATIAFARWREDPYSLKAMGDLAFCDGVNRFVLHAGALQPWTNRWPGMTYCKFGSHFDRTVTWWEQGRAWVEYLTRSQFILQQGRFVADAAVYCGENPLSDMFEIHPELPPGCDYDGVNDDVLLTQASVSNGLLVLKSGMTYRALLLSQPENTMMPKMLRKLRDFVSEGLTLVGPPPEKSPSLEGYPKCDAEVKSLVAEMWGNCDGKAVTEHRLGKGKVVWGQTMAQVFAALNVKPDFEFTADGGAKMAFIHRLAGDADIYFVSNQRDQADALDCTFRVGGKVPELWHPDTGRIEQAAVWREADGRITIPLKFDPAGSVFVIFRKPADKRDHIVSATGFGELKADANGQVTLCATSSGTVELKTASGKNLKLEVRDVIKPLEVSGPWALNFPPNWGAPATVTLDKLISWTEHTDSGVKYFSGTATYVKEVEIPAAMIGAGYALSLDLGQVKNIAEVSVNGKPLGILWKPPFRADIIGAVKPGKNKLEIKVTNLWPNRLIGDEQFPDDCVFEKSGTIKEWPAWLTNGLPRPEPRRLTFTTWKHWKKDDKLLSSGLLGPVTIQAAEVKRIKL